MRSSEEMGYAMFKAARLLIEPDLEEVPTWDELLEKQQQVLLACVNAALEYLFEHGRISSYLDVKQLEAYGAEYRAYLTEKREVNR